MTRSLARRVGEAGRVVGLDMDDVKLTSAREECRQAAIGNIDFRLGNVTDWSEPGAYDLVYGRFILSHLASRVATVGAMRDALRPGGILVLEDIDFAGAFCHPPHPGLRPILLPSTGQSSSGAAVTPPWAPRSGACAPTPVSRGRGRRWCTRCTRAPHPRRRCRLSTLVNIDEARAGGRPCNLRRAASGRSSEMTALTEDPTSLVGLPRIFQVLARKADAAAAP